MNQNENKMNKNLDLTKILKDCPKGTKLYSPLFGDVEFYCISELGMIFVKSYPDNISLDIFEYFYKDERYASNYGNAECILFPSKENRDWSTFKVEKEPKFKAGDYIYGEEETLLVIGYNGKDYGLCDRKGNTSPTMVVYIEDKFRLCNPDEVDMFKKSLHENGLHWSKSQNKLVHWYRPFERVLVRVDKLRPWRCNLFSHYDRNKEMFVFANGGLLRNEECILPFEGNENKLGKITE